MAVSVGTNTVDASFPVKVKYYMDMLWMLEKWKSHLYAQDAS